ncbi:MAG: hypothetical protein LPK85_03550 [Gammaproteobacteria bacterium]|nr:hypothetical protein [Gammaproteobacteria bacterium]
MASLQNVIERRLRLKINVAKSAVDKPGKRSFLGFTFSRNAARLKVADKASRKLKERVRELSARSRSLSRIMEELGEMLRGWKAY